MFGILFVRSSHFPTSAYAPTFLNAKSVVGAEEALAFAQQKREGLLLASSVNFVTFTVPEVLIVRFQQSIQLAMSLAHYHWERVLGCRSGRGFPLCSYDNVLPTHRAGALSQEPVPNALCMEDMIPATLQYFQQLAHLVCTDANGALVLGVG